MGLRPGGMAKKEEGETGGGERGREGGGFDLNLGTSIEFAVIAVIVVVAGKAQLLLSMPKLPFNRSVNEDFIWVLSLSLSVYPRRAGMVSRA